MRRGGLHKPRASIVQVACTSRAPHTQRLGRRSRSPLCRPKHIPLCASPKTRGEYMRRGSRERTWLPLWDGRREPRAALFHTWAAACDRPLLRSSSVLLDFRSREQPSPPLPPRLRLREMAVPAVLSTYTIQLQSATDTRQSETKEQVNERSSASGHFGTTLLGQHTSQSGHRRPLRRRIRPRR
ncbi:hypothetical protein L227DRAFT_244005 [Lentinus tigrinus ALCF2SS1-6]|uniref:Uncharacterized protein n=1 Tax=Lentinus tigrinus ALCF2SS1-6 TaxID=1328759 RepID=A0A5C2S0F2_9APHY|nr:hypothetical protein L227DRAFT_244005 [Lentinus tigrinus ALCF2SS1-6]